MHPSFYLTILLIAPLALASSAPAQEKGGKPRIPLGIKWVEVGDPPARTLVVKEVPERVIGYRLGLVAGDVIVGVNGHKVDSLDRLRELLESRKATIVWKGKDGNYYRNTIVISETDGPVREGIIGFTVSKRLEDVEKIPDQLLPREEGKDREPD
jgi:S1-C subfamily serine protease